MVRWVRHDFAVHTDAAPAFPQVVQKILSLSHGSRHVVCEIRHRPRPDFAIITYIRFVYKCPKFGQGNLAVRMSKSKRRIWRSGTGDFRVPHTITRNDYFRDGTDE